MRYLFSLRSALASVSASYPLRSHGCINSISRDAASPARLENLRDGFWSLDNVAIGVSAKHMSHCSGNLGLNSGLLASKDDVFAPYALSFRSFIHSFGRTDSGMGSDSNTTDFTTGQKEFETGRNLRPAYFSARQTDFATVRNPSFVNNSAGQQDYEVRRNSRPMDSSAGQRNFEMGRNSRPIDLSMDRRAFEMGRNSRPMDFVRGIIEQDGSKLPRYTVEQCSDFVLIKLTRNNTFVSVMDSRGHMKKGASMTAGWLQEQQGGPKLARYAAEATAEHVGQAARELGLKSFVMRVNGFAYFKKKRQAIMSFREGYCNSRSGPCPITHIEDTTRRPHNGCRLPKKRRI